jgi:hypothetical protein
MPIGSACEGDLLTVRWIDCQGCRAPQPQSMCGIVRTVHVAGARLPLWILRFRQAWLPLGAALIFAISAFGSYSSVDAAADIKVTLAGDQKVPPGKSVGPAPERSSFGADRSVSGSVTTNGIAGTAAHIHKAATGKNGPVIIPLTKNGDTYAIAADAKLSDAQFARREIHTSTSTARRMRAKCADN